MEGVDQVKMRCATEADYDPIIASLNNWWGGRQMADMLPRLFFVHFSDTSFVVERNGEIVGFLAGFLSQARPGEAYIHFAGVHPSYRGQGIGRSLYERFLEVAAVRGRTVVRCVTSPVNRDSVAFHVHMGFSVEPGGAELHGIAVHSEYDGPGQDRVVFVKRLAPRDTRARG